MCLFSWLCFCQWECLWPYPWGLDWSIGKTCMYGRDTWDTIVRGCWQSGRWPVLARGRTRSGNGLGEFPCSKRGSACPHVSGSHSLRRQSRSHNTWYPNSWWGTGNISRDYHWSVWFLQTVGVLDIEDSHTCNLGVDACLVPPRSHQDQTGASQSIHRVSLFLPGLALR